MNGDEPIIPPPQEEDLWDMVFNGIFGIVAAGTVTIFLTLALLFILEMLM